jgi:hypothetical protein
MGTAGATGGAPVTLVGVTPLAVTSASVKCQSALGTATVFSPQIVAIQMGAIN